LIEYGSPQLTEIGGWESLTKCIHEVHKCLVVDRQSRENLFLLERLYRRAIGDMVEYCHTLNEMLEVMPKGVSKLSALRRLTEMLKMDMNRVMAFGDGNNDAEMLKNVGVGIAVENATEFAKTSADLVVPSCDENGPAIFLQDLLKKSHPNQDDRKGEPVILN